MTTSQNVKSPVRNQDVFDGIFIYLPICTLHLATQHIICRASATMCRAIDFSSKKVLKSIFISLTWSDSTHTRFKHKDNLKECRALNDLPSLVSVQLTIYQARVTVPGRDMICWAETWATILVYTLPVKHNCRNFLQNFVSWILSATVIKNIQGLTFVFTRKFFVMNSWSFI